mmetsp:Transcript_8923/g.15470  ORF Transcript_8923/g.15470 Transcript_8923/m.15470 type:complete len:304 (-) Transcript_8923:359-1270(-)
MLDDSKVEQFVLLAKGARGRSVVETINRATSEPGLFGFSELLVVPSVKEIANGEHAAHFRLLEMFAYGTWPEYKLQAAQLPTLTSQQSMKLKQLTVVTLALAQKTIPYQLLQKELDIATVRELEDFLITECFYSYILKGKLDQKKACLQVHDVVGRDVRQEELLGLEQGLRTWLAAAQSLIGDIDGRVEAAATAAAAGKQRQQIDSAEVEDMRRTVKAELELKGGDMLLDDNAGGGYDLMDEDRMDRFGGGGPAPYLPGGSGAGASSGAHHGERHEGRGAAGEAARHAARSKKRMMRPAEGRH